jgi:putative Mg2+ transporter-C (MgtC) family protein
MHYLLGNMQLLKDILLPDAHTLQSALKLAIAMICGLIVGLERSYRGKPAGIRTNILISMGSCLFMIVSQYVAESARAEGFATPDPARIAAQVVTGIGFLGAGTILRNRGLITGLTSAASVWVVAAIGLSVGAGLIKVSIFLSVFIVAIMEFFRIVVKRIRLERFHYGTLEVILKKDGIIQDVRKAIRHNKATYMNESKENILGEIHYRATINYRGDMQAGIIETVRKINGVRHCIIYAQAVE